MDRSKSALFFLMFIMLLNEVHYLETVTASVENILFEDGFENETLSAWDEYVVGPNAYLNITNEVSFSGKSSLKVNSTMKNDGLAYIWKKFDSGYNRITVNFKWKLEKDVKIKHRVNWVGLGYNQLSGSGISIFLKGRLVNTSSINSNSLMHYPTSSLGYSLEGIIEKNKWYDVKIIYQNGLDGIISLNIDGKNILYKEGDLRSKSESNYFVLGIYEFDGHLENDTKSICQYFDDIIINYDYKIFIDDKRAGANCTFSLLAYDEDGLDTYTLSTNITGDWTSVPSYSWENSPNTAWGNVTARLPIILSNYSNPVMFMFNYNDTLGNEYVTTKKHFLISEKRSSIYEMHFESTELNNYYFAITHPANISLSNSVYLHGNSSLMIESSEGGPKGRARIWGDYVVKDWNWGSVLKTPDASEIHSRIYFYLDEASGSWNINPLSFVSSKYEKTQYLMWTIIYPNKISMRRYFPTDATHNFQVNIQKQRWYCLEQAMFIDESEGWYRVWLDESLILNDQHLNTTNLRRGVGNAAQIGVVHYSTIPNEIIIYIDDHIVSPSYIGPFPTDEGESYVNNTLLSEGEIYLHNAINLSATHVEWIPKNGTLRLNFRSTTYNQLTNGVCEIFWNYIMDQNVEINFLNGTIKKAEDFYNPINKIIKINISFDKDDDVSILIYYNIEDQGDLYNYYVYLFIIILLMVLCYYYKYKL